MGTLMLPQSAELVQISLRRSLPIFCHVWLWVTTTTVKLLNCTVTTVLPTALGLKVPLL